MQTVKKMLTVDIALTALVGILFSWFCFTGKRWIDAMEERTARNNALIFQAAQERVIIKAEADAHWQEIIRRLERIERKTDER